MDLKLQESSREIHDKHFALRLNLKSIVITFLRFQKVITFNISNTPLLYFRSISLSYTS